MSEFAVVPQKIIDLVYALDAHPLNGHDGAWVYQIDDAWRVAVNGHESAVTVPEADGCMACDELGPFHFAVWFNGWLCGLMTPFEGVFAAGAAANEDAFIVAVDAAIARIKSS